MTPGRPGSDHGRGGQGGREPRATVQARALRVLDRSVAGLSQREIAAEEGISQSAVSKILQRLEARVLEELVGRVEQQKIGVRMFEEPLARPACLQSLRTDRPVVERASPNRQLQHPAACRGLAIHRRRRGPGRQARPLIGPTRLRRHDRRRLSPKRRP